MPTTIHAASSPCRIRNQYLGKLGILPTPLTITRPKIAPRLLWKKQQFLEESQRTSTGGVEKDLPEELPDFSLRGLAFLDSSQSLPSLASSEESESDDGEKSFSSEEAFYDQAEETEMNSLCENLDEVVTLSKTRSNHRVSFLPTVAVYEIPSHRSYDKLSHRSMWNSLQVQELNARRNRLEFWAENKDWRNAYEEEDMIKTRTGELVHPATWKLLCEHMARMARKASPKSRRRSRPTSATVNLHKYLVCVGGAPSLTRFADT